MAGVASAAGAAAKWIASSLAEEGEYLYGIEDVVQSLQKDLECIQILLESVDETPHRRLQVDGQLRNFTKEIRELAFRAEDVIDAYVVDVGSKISRKNLLAKLICLVSHCYPVHMLRMEIENIKQQMEDTKNRFESYGRILPLSTCSNQQQQGIGGPSPSQPNPENYIHLVDEIVVGIDDVVSQLVQHLIDPASEFKVVGIVGGGGGGKTTLTTQIYHHSNVGSRFPHKAFVSISQQWSRSDLFTRIFKQLKGNDCAVPDTESELVRGLYEFLKQKQCLVVLDDMWKSEDWDAIYPVFPQANRGCKVIITTRINEVVLHADHKCLIHQPNLLTEDQKWELFSKIAVEGRAHIENNGEFKKLGKQMLGKCEGIPLTVVTLAGILRTKQELYQWEEICHSYFDNILKGKGSMNYGVVEDMLELSYLDLPTHLKQCFLYLACFPEDYTIFAEIVIRMWIAEGFIMDDLQERYKTLEDAGRHLLDELAQRCILQVTERDVMGKILTFRLHDIMREFCIKTAKEYQFFGTITSTLNYVNIGRSTQPRRISIISRGVDINNSQLRTLTLFGSSDYQNSLKTFKSIAMEKFKLLRVLHIDHARIGCLPNQIGDLIYLRYLHICNANIYKLPKSFSNLQNLLYLEWKEVFVAGVEVSNDLACKMENLRCLSLPSYHAFNLKSLGINGSNKLHTLKVSAGKWMLKELPSLSLALQHLSIGGIDEVAEIEAIYECPSIIQNRLSVLKISSLRMGDKVQFEFELLRLRHCTTLRKLHLDMPLVMNCSGLTSYFPPDLVDLSLEGSRIERDDLMQIIGELRRLKSLSLEHESYIGRQLRCGGEGGFPRLLELRLQGLPNLEEWRMEEGAMCVLRKMKICGCEKLKRLPESIRSITTLKELQIQHMPEEFCNRLEQNGEDSVMIQHISTVRFTNTLMSFATCLKNTAAC